VRVQQFFKNFLMPVDHGRNRVTLFGAPAAFASESLPGLLIAEQTAHGIRKGRRVPAGNQQSRSTVLDDFAQSTDICGYNRQTAGHGFQDNVGKTFHDGAQSEQTAPGKQRPQIQLSRQ